MSVPVVDELAVGRDPARNGLVLSDPRVGRRHAVLTSGAADGLRVALVDRHEATSGGRHLASGSALAGGAIVRIGQTRLRVLEAVAFDRTGTGAVVTAVDTTGRRQRHDLSGSTRVGRDATWADIVVDDQSASGRHCVLELVEGGLAIDDRSRHGTLLNGRRVGKGAVAGPGDIVGIGTTQLVVEHVRAAPATRTTSVLEVMVEESGRTYDLRLDVPEATPVAEVAAAIASHLGLAPCPRALHREHDGLFPSAASSWDALPLRRGERWILGAGAQPATGSRANGVGSTTYMTTVVREPRRVHQLSVHPVELPPVPDDVGVRARGVPWQVAGSGVSLGMALVVSIIFPSKGLWFLLAGSAGAGACLAGLMADRARRRAARRRFDTQVSELDEELDGVVGEQERGLREASPPMTDVGRSVEALDELVWSRRPADTDFLCLRVGLGDRPAAIDVRSTDRWRAASFRQRLDELLLRHETLHDVPVCTPGAPGALVAVVGPAEAVDDVGRALVVQAAAQHAPSELRIAVLTTSDQWRWARWLPHVAGLGDTTFVAWSTATLDEVAHRVDDALTAAGTDVRARSGAAGLLRPRWWVLVTSMAAGRPSVRALVDRLRADGAVITVLADGPASLPADPDWLLDLRGAPEVVQRSARTHLSRVEGLARDDADGAAHTLGRYLDARAAQRGAGTDAGALELWGVTDVEQVDAPARWRERPPGFRSVAIGSDDAGDPVAIGFRDGNPHGFVAGITGSGKSELLKTFIAGLVLEHPPEQLSLFLLDFKGGSAFRELAPLPHVVGLVTDIEADATLAARAFLALDAELLRRKSMLAAARCGDILDYEILPCAADRPMPSLLVVIDEFAALMQHNRDLAASLDSVAMQGRALGVHLLLAAQDPSGVITPAISANTGLWVGLRVARPEHSKGVIGSDDAAFIPASSPGRAFLRRGGEAATAFQTARIARPVRSVERPTVEVRSLGSDDDRAGLATTDPSRERGTRVTELEVLVDRICAETARARAWMPTPLWLPPLPSTVDGATLPWPDRPPARPAALLGLVDDPSVPEQGPGGIDLSTAGHALVLGRLGSGRTTTLLQLAVDLARHHAPDEVHLYGLDAGDGALGTLERLPHCGAVVGVGDVERTTSLLRRLLRAMERRREGMSSAGAADFTMWRTRSIAPEPWIIVLVDDVGILRQAFDRHPDQTLSDLFTVLCQGGPAVGIHLLIGATQSNDARAQLLSLCGAKVALAVADGSDVQGLPPGRSRDLPAFARGRGYLVGASALLVQVAHPGSPDTWPCTDDVACGPASVRRLPRPGELTFSSLPAATGTGLAVIGVGGDEVEAVEVDLSRHPHLVVLGEPGSGRSTTAAVVTRAAMAGDRARRVIVLAPRGGPLEMLLEGTAPGCVTLAVTADEIFDVLRPIVEGSAGPSLLVIDDAEALPAGVAEPLGRIVRDARRLDVRTVTAGRATDVLRLYDDWVRYIVSLRHAILLSPSPDLEIAFDLRPVRLRPPPTAGRGLYVVQGASTSVQIADLPAS